MEVQGRRRGWLMRRWLDRVRDDMREKGLEENMDCQCEG